jgi:hypothetical protein
VLTELARLKRRKKPKPKPVKMPTLSDALAEKTKGGY